MFFQRDGTKSAEGARPTKTQNHNYNILAELGPDGLRPNCPRLFVSTFDVTHTFMGSGNVEVHTEYDPCARSCLPLSIDEPSSLRTYKDGKYQYGIRWQDSKSETRRQAQTRQ